MPRLLRRLRSTTFQVAALAAVIASVLVAIIAEMVRNLFASAAPQWPIVVDIIGLVVLLVIGVYLNRIMAKLDRIDQKIGLSIKYYDCMGQDVQKLDNLHRAARGVITRAKKNARLFAVNSYVEVFKESHKEAGIPTQRTYLAEYVDSFEKFSTYHRLIQLKNGHDPRGNTNRLAERLTPAYLEHYQRMVEFRARYPDRRIKLEEVQARLPTSFVVVCNPDDEGGEIIWQMNQHAPREDDPDAVEMIGIFVIEDPDAQMTTELLRWFAILDSGTARVLTMDDLT